MFPSLFSRPSLLKSYSGMEGASYRGCSKVYCLSLHCLRPKCDPQTYANAWLITIFLFWEPSISLCLLFIFVKWLDNRRLLHLYEKGVSVDPYNFTGQWKIWEFVESSMHIMGISGTWDNANSMFVVTYTCNVDPFYDVFWSSLV